MTAATYTICSNASQTVKAKGDKGNGKISYWIKCSLDIQSSSLKKQMTDCHPAELFWDLYDKSDTFTGELLMYREQGSFSITDTLFYCNYF